MLLISYIYVIFGIFFAVTSGLDMVLIKQNHSNQKGDVMMKKFLTVLISLALLTSVAIAPVYAGGDKNHGDVGTGDTNQGDVGSGASPGDNAQGNQVDPDPDP